MQIHIGTSGWHYAHWRGPFYPEDLVASKMLRWYVQHFDSVELNNTFYRLPTDDALKIWYEQTPPGFCFALKASRYITHRKRLLEPENTVKNFLPRVEKLGDKLGPILFQLPPRWHANADRLEHLLKILPRRHRYTLEFRDASWNNPTVFKVLRRYNAAYCISEIAGYQSPVELTADFSYVRLHGPGEKAYQGDYSEAQLRRWAKLTEAWKSDLNQIFFYFDNDQFGYAAKNALELKHMIFGVESSSASSPRAA
jgi:uncharacterized protein YecE (DUF72 family)